MVSLSATRDSRISLDFKDAMLNPNAPYGGLYSFVNIQPFNSFELKSLQVLGYKNLAKAIFSKLDINLDSNILDNALNSYDSFEKIAPLRQIEDKLFSLELYYGPTSAFKDMALAPFGSLISQIASKEDKKFLILSATSGDTGPATLSSLANKQNIKAICMYPKNGTSDIQRLQMSTNDAKNINVFAINGDFDAAQSTLKELLKDSSFIKACLAKGYHVSAANSVNIARIAFQIIYYFHIKNQLVTNGLDSKFSVIIPSGNFGNALGAFYAKQLGLDIKTIFIATNPNDILHEFIQTGIYDISNKTLKLSFSPAMDILKSSNIERVLFSLFGSSRTKELLEELDSKKIFKLDKNELELLRQNFSSDNFSDIECKEGIARSFKDGYLLDPHTSNAYLLAKKLDKNELKVIISTASFAKFPRVVLDSLSPNSSYKNDFEALEEIYKITSKKAPLSILNLLDKKEVFTKSFEIGSIKEEILSWI